MKISAHMVVKNEERWVWFAIMSVIDYVDEVLIIDMKSTDKTLEIIKSIHNPKIKFFGDLGDAVANRNFLITQNKSKWILILDGDEVWTENGIKELVSNLKNNFVYLVSPFKNLLGDVYHYQDESAGKYEVHGRKGHLTIRAINVSQIPGLHVIGTYPLEGYCDKDDMLIQNDPDHRFNFMKNIYLHMTHLLRSSRPISNKHKYEWGHPMPGSFEYPKCFYLPRSEIISSPWKKRGLGYVLNASWQTPLKLIKRRVFN